jgi:hypothetical protein
MKKFGNFKDVIKWTSQQMYDLSYVVHTEKWQGKDIKTDPKYSMIEILNHSFTCQINGDLDSMREQINPNVSWADEHFEERVSKLPLNPPPSHERWPYAQKNNAEFGGMEKFSHTYPERIWPKYGEMKNILRSDLISPSLKGIRYDYGDFNDVVSLMAREPFTRQAFLPIWFPEDTGAVEGQRVPCFVAGTLVQTSSGYKEIENIKEGELVITHKGRFKKVQQIFKSEYNDSIIEIETENTNIPIETTKDHPFLIIRSQGKSPSHRDFIWEEEWVNSEDIKEGDYVVHSFLDEIVDSGYSGDMMRLFGYYLSEGDIMYDKRNGRKSPKTVRFSMSKKDLNLGYIDDLIDIIEKDIGKKVYIKKSIKVDDKENLRIYLHDTNFASLVHNIFGSGSFEKKIPEIILKTHPSLQYQLLIGYTRGDGSFEKNKKNIECTSISKSIIMGLRTICLRNNINTSLQRINLRTPYFNKRLGRLIKPNYETFKLVFSQGGRLAKDFFSIDCGKNEKKIYKKDYFKNNRVIFKIKKIRKNNVKKITPVYNLQVEDDNTYNIINCTVHNCTIGYHFIRRADWVHVVYYIRSCDFFRHFRDDIYLCIRKLFWLIENLQRIDPENWEGVKPGTLTMHITSLHAWASEKPMLLKTK